MAKNTDNPTKLKTWDDVEKELKALGKADANITYLKNLANDMKRRRDELEERVRVFVEAHADDLGPSKKKLLDGGQVALLDSTSVEIDDEDACLDYLRRNRLENCFKTDFKVIKTALKSLGEDVQEAAGVHIVTRAKLSLKLTPQSPAMKVDMQ